jgi:hypothetical protein
MIAEPSRIRTRGGSSLSEHAGGLCSVTSIFCQACDESTFVRRLTPRCQATVGHADLRTTTRSFVILLRSVIEWVVTAAAVIWVRVGQIAPWHRGPAGSAVRLQPDRGHDTTSPVRVVDA